MQLLLRGVAQAVAALPPARDLRQAVRGGDPRRLPRRRLRAGARLPSPRRRRTTTTTRVGLPEVKVGLFPGAGGTQRVARLMQTGDALQMLFKGEQIRPLMAAQHGPRARGRAARRDRREGEGLDQGRRLGRRALGRRRLRLPSGKVYSPAGMRSGRRPTRSIAARRTTTTRPPRRSCRRSIEGLQLPMDLALKVESALLRQDPALARRRRR